jgi:hypothetical protein
MPVLVTAEVPGQTPEGFKRILAAVEPAMRESKGFIAVGSGLTPEGVRCFEIWETADDATQFFARHIHPNLPAEITPKRSILELHTFLKT